MTAPSTLARVSGDSKPRVLLAFDFHAKYGTNLARGLIDAGADVMVLSRDHDLEFGGETGEGDPGALRRYVERRLAGRGVHAEIPSRVSDPWALPALVARRREVRRFAPDVIHVQEGVWNDPRLVAVAALRPGRYAITIHDPALHPGDLPDALPQRIGRRQLIRRAGLIFVHSHALAAELVEGFAPKAPIAVVPHGTELPAQTPVPAVPTILSFGRLSHYKGIDVLLDALPEVWATVPDARLVIAGAGELPDHPLLADPRVDVRHRHVHEEEVEGLFSAARVVVLPYRQASQSGVGSRAKTYGRPLVVTEVGALPELVADGSGEVVAPEDPQALAATLVRVLATPGLAEEQGRRAALGAAGSSWPRVAERTLAAYADALRGARGRARRADAA